MKKSIITISILVLVKIFLYNTTLAQFAPTPVVFVPPQMNKFQLSTKPDDEISMVLNYTVEYNINDLVKTDLTSDVLLGSYKLSDSIICNEEIYKVKVLAQYQNYKIEINRK